MADASSNGCWRRRATFQGVFPSSYEKMRVKRRSFTIFNCFSHTINLQRSKIEISFKFYIRAHSKLLTIKVFLLDVKILFVYYFLMLFCPKISVPPVYLLWLREGTALQIQSTTYDFHILYDVRKTTSNTIEILTWL